MSIDTEYLAAVERGDMDTARRLMVEFAVSKGYVPVEVYHGTLRKFYVFDATRGKKDQPGNVIRDAVRTPQFFSFNENFAKDYANFSITNWRDLKKVRLIKAFLRYDKLWDYRNPGDVDAAVAAGFPRKVLEEGEWGAIESTPFQRWLQENGYDAFTNFERFAVNIAVFKPSQIKSAETVSMKGSKIVPLSKRFDVTKDDIRNPRTPNPVGDDVDYLAAVERGDMKTAQRMVNEVAKKSGYSEKAFHGSPEKEVTVFNIQRTSIGYFFSPDPLTAGYYAGDDGKVYEVWLRMEKTLDLTDEFNLYNTAEEVFGGNKKRDDEKVKEFAEILYNQGYGKNDQVTEFFNKQDGIKEVDGKTYTVLNLIYDNYISQEEIDDLVGRIGVKKVSDAYEKHAPSEDPEVKRVVEAYGTQSFYMDYQNDLLSWAEGKYDSVIIDDPSSTGEPISYVVFKSSQIKSADPVTYDDSGKVIPLSKRFDVTKDDIRNPRTRSTPPQFPYEYAAYLKKHFPKIWAAGGNIRGNDTFRWWTAYRQGDRSPTVMHWWDVTRPAWIARHFQDHRLPGVVAQIKWGTVGTLGVAGMKRVVEDAIRHEIR